MTRYFVELTSRHKRDQAIALIEAAPSGSRVEIKAAKRTLPQNDRMWAMLTEVARQVKWHGHTLRPDDWKLIFLDGLKRELQSVPNLDGDGFVSLRQSSSDLTKDEMSNMIELIYSFGANPDHPVEFADVNTTAA